VSGPRRIFASAFLGDLSMHVALGSFSYRATTLGASPAGIGLIGGLIDLVYTAVALSLPRITDGRSRAAVVRVSAGAMLAGGVACWQAHSIAAFVCGLALLRAGSALFWPTLQARLSDGHAHELGRAVGAFSLSWCCGKALGYGVNAVGLGGGAWNPRDSFLITICGAALLILLAPADRARPAAGASPPVLPPGVPRRRVVAAWIGAFLACAAFVVLQNQNAPLMAAKGHAAGFGNLMLACLVGFNVLVFEFLRRKPHLAGEDRALVGSLALLAAGTAVLVVSLAAPGLLAGASLIGLGMGLAYTQSLFLSLRLPHRKSVAAGIHEAFIGIGNATVAPLAGAATQISGSANGSLLFSLVLLISGGAYVLRCLRIARRSRAVEA
jgi:MFS family permease